MPMRLLDRCGADSIREFRAAANLRFNDALALAASGRRTAAIYLWGYVAEMSLKAAGFALIGHPETASLSWAVHISPAIAAGRAMGIAWPNSGAGHNVRAWAEFLVLARAINPATAYPPDLALAVQANGQRIGRLWRETLRYHKNFAYRYEVSQMREATEWMLVNSNNL